MSFNEIIHYINSLEFTHQSLLLKIQNVRTVSVFLWFLIRPSQSGARDFETLKVIAFVLIFVNFVSAGFGNPMVSHSLVTIMSHKLVILSI